MSTAMVKAFFQQHLRRIRVAGSDRAIAQFQSRPASCGCSNGVATDSGISPTIRLQWPLNSHMDKRLLSISVVPVQYARHLRRRRLPHRENPHTGSRRAAAKPEHLAFTPLGRHPASTGLCAVRLSSILECNDSATSYSRRTKEPLPRRPSAMTIIADLATLYDALDPLVLTMITVDAAKAATGRAISCFNLHTLVGIVS